MTANEAKLSPRFSRAALGIVLQARLKELGITGGALAKKTGISSSVLSRLLRGKAPLELVEAVQVAEVLGITIEQLVDGARKVEQSGAVEQLEKAREDLGQAQAAIETVLAAISPR